MGRFRRRGVLQLILLACLLPAASFLGCPERAGSQTRDAVRLGDGSRTAFGERIWGRVVTKNGERYEGYLRFASTRHQAAWADLLHAEQPVAYEPLRTWLNASRGTANLVRTIEVRGYRISWNADGDDFVPRSGNFPGRRAIGIPYGSLIDLRAQPAMGRTQLLTARLRTATGDGEAADPTEHVWSGERGTVNAYYANAWDRTRIEVDDIRHGRVTISADALARVEFSDAPAGQEHGSARLFGTVEDRSGRAFTGFVTWDGDKVLDSDSLGGRWDGSPPGSVPMGDIRSIERRPAETPGGSKEIVLVTLVAGNVVELATDADPENSLAAEVAVVDPRLGTVSVGWDRFRVLRLYAPAPGPANQHPDRGQLAVGGYDTFDGGVPLRGTVVTDSGEEIKGRIRWSMLKEWTWDLLHGSMDGTEVAVRFANIRSLERIAPAAPTSVRTAAGTALPERFRITLLDGRTYEMSQHRDQFGDTGILVRSDAPAPAGWRLVRWEDFRVVRFEHPRRDGS